ncbi:MAG: DUF4294 domain-containing protein [Marinilabiliaceae bacterium]|nr:DUF4294 domain-containing protein [Marinilabiliaceae bacterium]
MKKWIVILFFCGVINAKAQLQLEHGELNLLEGIVVDGDTIPHYNLPVVYVTPPWKFKSKREVKRYSRLVFHVKKTLPYARMAGKKIREINAHLETIKSDKEKKIYLKQAEKELFDEFEAPLRKLTFTQGRILINLIDRETGDTGYNLIKEYKGGVSAFFWQSVARVFGSNLKDEYDPEGDDKMIENIVIRLDNGLL